MAYLETQDKIYMTLAKNISQLSEDERTKVGAIIATKNYTDICYGFNTKLIGCKKKINWHSNEKYNYVAHAEVNAITYSAKHNIDIKDAKIFLTLSPCIECLKLLCQFGIKQIYFLEKYKTFDEVNKIAQELGIELIQVEENNGRH